MATRATSAPDLEALLLHLKEARGFDFAGYRRATLEQRVRRRMRVVNVTTYADYLDYLDVHPEEFEGLFNTIFLNVTSFFRDAEAWALLRSEIVPQLLTANSSGPIRVWSAGCATAEKAYGLGIVFADALGMDVFRERVTIYATDVDEDALATAGQATVSEQALAQMPSDIQQKYFEPNGGCRTFRSDLRRSVIFGRHDLLQDAPVSRIDLLSCRNTLMYFNADAQRRILERFRFALRDYGVLFLGRAEMLLAQRNLFEPVDRKHRFFRKVPTSAPVTFDDATRFHKLQEEYEDANRQLEAAYAELQSTNEELQTTNEELQSTVEQLEATNQELQSTNEELDTMDEELRSMNDELQSITEELRDRTSELDNVNDFLDSVLASLQTAVVVLGKDMDVQAWNRRAEDFWGLRQDEVIGQHFLNLDIGLPVHELASVIRSVLAGEPAQPQSDGVVLDAVNRRGRPVFVRVSYGPLASADEPVGVIMAMDELDLT
jgi:PAS domain S-box-containing protein